MSQVEKGYDIWSKDYDLFDNPMIAIDEIVFSHLIDNLEGLDVLDLGCGTGRNSLKALKKGANLTGVDVSEGMLEKARNKTFEYSATFIKHDLSKKLPFDNESFDVILASLVLEHIENIESFFNESYRICRPNGKVLISEMHPYMFYKNIQAHFKDTETGMEINIGSHKRFLSDFVNAAITAGFNINKIAEFEANEQIINLVPKAIKHAGQPMLFTMQLEKSCM